VSPRVVDPAARVLAAARRRPPPSADPPADDVVDILARAVLERATPPAPRNPATGKAVPELPPAFPVGPLPDRLADPLDALGRPRPARP